MCIVSSFILAVLLDDSSFLLDISSGQFCIQFCSCSCILCACIISSDGKYCIQFCCPPFTRPHIFKFENAFVLLSGELFSKLQDLESSSQQWKLYLVHIRILQEIFHQSE